MITSKTNVLEKEIIVLKTEVVSLKKDLTFHQEKCQHLEAEHEALRQMILASNRARFGSKSERYTNSDISQLPLFNSVEEVAIPDSPVDEAETITYTRRKKRTKQESTESLPRVEIVIPVSSVERRCECGSEKGLVKYETKEKLHYQPAVFEIQIEKREVLACPKGCDGSMVTAPAPQQLLPKIKASDELLSHIAVSKIMDRQPLYHLEKQFDTRYHVKISRQTMAKWMIELAVAFQPIVNLLKDTLLSYDVAGLDATTLQVLHESDRKAQTKSYVYCIRGGPLGKEVVLWDYNDRDHKPFLDEWFLGYNGYIHVDADPFFDNLPKEDERWLCKCNAHARRKFEAIVKATKTHGLAKEAMCFYREIYKVEREAKDRDLTPDERYRLRQEKTAPLMVKFKTWLGEKYPMTLPQTHIGKAIKYCLNHWDGLTMFLKDGRLEVDNNLTEQQIKTFVMGRKNWLFSDTVAGAHSLAIHYGLMLTAKKHKLDPFKYYCAIIKRLPLCTSIQDYEALLPWNIQLGLPPA